MIYTVTFNPSLDYIVGVESFKCGEINRTIDERIFPGGKGINVSIVLKNLGCDTTAIGFLAGFTGDNVVRLLQEKGVKTDFIHVQEGLSRINVKLRSMMRSEDVKEKNSNRNFIVKEETEINGQGPVITKGDIEKLYVKLDKLKAGDVLVLAGSIPGSIPYSIYMDIMQYLAEKEIRIVVDATKELLRNVLPYQPFLVKPNNHELGELFGVTLNSKDDVIFYAKKLQKLGAKNVLVSMAKEGALLITENGCVLKADAPEGMVKNSVGAGDSMVAGFLAGYLENDDYEKALKMGVCAGSASAFSEELATLEEVQYLNEMVDIVTI